VLVFVGLKMVWLDVAFGGKFPIGLSAGPHRHAAGRFRRRLPARPTPSAAERRAAAVQGARPVV